MNRVLLEVRQKKSASGIILEGQPDYNEFYIADLGPNVSKEFKKGQQAILVMAQVPSRKIGDKHYALVEDIDIWATE
jgi:co-chaperonin GroES (HSP10)